MVYAYIRVSTDKQTVENQRFEIERFIEQKQLGTPAWVEETISGAKSPDMRQLGVLMERCESGDVIVCSELSRLGRTLFMIVGILDFCLSHGIQVYTVKDGFHLCDDIPSKVLAFAFGLSAEIERNLISQRTRESLARLKAMGVKLGRPYVLTGSEENVYTTLKTKSLRDTARIHGVSVNTIQRLLRRQGLTVALLRSGENFLGK